MTHPEAGTLRAYADGELNEPEEIVVEAHLEGCPECRTELEDLRGRARLISESLRLVDTAPPVERARSTVSRRLRGAVDLERSGRRLARAAALTLAVVVGAAGLLSAAPVRGFVLDVWSRVTSGHEEPPRVVPPERLELPPLGGEPTPAEDEADPPAEPAPPLPLDAGVHMDASSQPVQIVLHGPASGLEVRVDFVEGSTVGVFGTVESRFRRAAGRIEARAGDGRIRIEVPRGAEDILVLVDGETWLLKRGDTLELKGPVLDRTPETVRFSRSGG